MASRRFLIVSLLAVAFLGSLAFTGGYAWYLRSDRYRQLCVDTLESELGLPCDIGAVAPQSWTSRGFRDVLIWLPDRRGPALRCDWALIRQTPLATAPDAYEVEIADGACEISPKTWLAEDVRTLLISGLSPGFSPEGPERVRFRGLDISFERDGFRSELRDAAGQVDFSDHSRAVIEAACRNFNDVATDGPVLLTATCVPIDSEIRVAHLAFETPDLPLTAARLDDLVGAQLSRGVFRGKLVYEEQEPPASASPGAKPPTLHIVQGRLADIDLAEVTTPLLDQPIHGYCAEIEMQELRVEGRTPTHLKFSGVLREVPLSDVLVVAGRPDVNATLTLDVASADFTPDGVREFIATGLADEIALRDVSRLVGYGEVSADARLVINDLTIRDNRLVSAKVLIETLDTDTPRWISGDLIRSITERALGVSMPPLLPDRVPFSKFGVRLEVKNERLYVYGTHGPREQTILTGEIFGRPVPLISEPADSYDLSPQLEQLRRRLEQTLRARLPRE